MVEIQREIDELKLKENTPAIVNHEEKQETNDQKQISNGKYKRNKDTL